MAAREIVTHWADGTETRTNWAGIARDARKLAQALEAMGVKRGDRVATLAMNHSRHLVAWYGAIGMGGVIHTINPRLFDEQLVYIANHAEDKVLFYDKALPADRRSAEGPVDRRSSIMSASTTARFEALIAAQTATIAGSRAPSASPACSATRPARPAIRRACSTSIARR